MSSPASPSFKIVGGDGKEYGPVDLATLQQWTREGRVARAMRAWDSRTGQWQPAEQIAELAPLFGVAPAVVPPPVMPPPPPVVPRTNALAVWSFALAMLSPCGCGCGSLPAVILGAIALAQIHARREGGRGLAVAGVILGVAGMVLALVWSLIWISLNGHWTVRHHTMHLI
jgi:Domain of unknown function (DUF4190)/GYF domain 2